MNNKIICFEMKEKLINQVYYIQYKYSTKKNYAF